MSQATKRTVSQRDGDERQNEEPAVKLIRLSRKTIFTGLEVHEVYKQKGHSASKAATVLTEKLFIRRDLSDDSILKQKKDVQVKIKNKIYKFIQRFLQFLHFLLSKIFQIVVYP